MAPKKSVKKKGDPDNEKGTEDMKKQATIKQSKDVSQQSKPNLSVSVNANRDAKKSDQEKDEPKKTETAELHRKVNLDEPQKLSEAEILERRKLRFNLIGTEVDADEAEKVKKQRLQKFGAVLPDSKQDLEKRKAKFGLKGPILPEEDESTLLKRKQKFGGEGDEVIKQDQGALQQRKKKFGVNNVALDDLIKQSKESYKFKRSKPKHFHHRPPSNHKKFKR